MKSKIELVLKIKVVTNFSGIERNYVGLYRKQKNRGWAYNIAASKDEKPLKPVFVGIEAFKEVRQNKKWIRSLDDAIIDLEGFVWTEGSLLFCHPEYTKPVMVAYEGHQELIAESWATALHSYSDDPTL